MNAIIILISVVRKSLNKIQYIFTNEIILKQFILYSIYILNELNKCYYSFQ